MKVSKREKLLSGALLATLFIVWMLSGEGNGVTSEETGTPLVSSGRIFEQYRRIRPLPMLKNAKQQEKTVSQRNIFQFGSRTVGIGRNGTSGELSDNENGAQMNTGEKKAGGNHELSGDAGTPQPPDVDFQVVGIILAGATHAAVITRSPELFVVRESQHFLDHFILKSVKREGIVIGYIDFKDELFIPLKKDGGLQ
ncbi:MAG: hypothetical protein GXO70_11460 [Acidobacteria bacterium]|nr:hypothetical protein [Acidobacteriota bacterium]